MREVLRKSPYFQYIAAFFICLLYFLFQFHHIQQYLDFDQIVYCNNILAALKYKTGIMFNSHHLHFEIGGKWFHQLMLHYFEKSGFTDVVFNNRLRGVVAACIGVFFIILYLKEMTGRLAWGVIGGVLTGFCHGYLSYATKVDTAIYPAAGMILILWIFVKIEKARKWSIILAIPAGIILFISVMFHQYMGIACITSVIALAVPSWFFPGNIPLQTFVVKKHYIKPEIEQSPGKRYSATLAVSVIGILLIAGGFFYTGETAYNLPFSRQEKRRIMGPFGNKLFQYWVMGYATDNKWGKGFIRFNPVFPFGGFKLAFLSAVPKKTLPSIDGKYNYDMKKPFDKYKLTHNLLGYFTIIALFGSLLLSPLLWNRYRRGLILVLLSLIGFSLFITYWEPYYYEFWLIPCLLVCVLGILFLNYLGEKCAIVLKRFAMYPFYLLLLIFTFFITIHNIQYHAVPYSRNQVLWGYRPTWKESYYKNLISTYIYNNPKDPYKDVYTE